jgi:ribosomal-protein-alanine N-acetyltransferase
MSGVRIRRLEPGDLAGAERIHDDSFGAERWDLQAIVEILGMPGAGGLMAEIPDAHGGATRSGFLLYLLIGPDAELLTLAVSHRARRRGIGTALVRSFLALAHRAGAVGALLEVAEDNAAAQALYAGLGFVASGRRKDYYQRPGNRRIAARLLRRAIP